MAPDTTLIAVQVAREQEWAYALWRDHYSAHDVRRLSALAPRDGGLGYELSPSAFKGLVEGYRERMGLGNVNREARLERQLDDIDTITRVAGHALRRAHEIEALDVHAAKLLLDAGKREAELLGLNAPTKLEADITTHDGTLDQLNAALVALGETPVNVAD
jgi:hypothetical protein